MTITLGTSAVFLICTHVLKPHQVGAQTEAPKNLQFSIASIRPSAPGKTLGEYTLTDDGLIEANSPLLWIIQVAYGITDPRAVIGAPQWADEERFDIKAKVDSDQLAQYKSLSPIEKGHLLQAVLIERFGLKAHTETRDFPGYALVVMKSGAKLHQSQAAPGQDAKRSWRISERYKLDAKNATMADLCFMLLSTEAQGTVIDETHLNGLYDFSLSWSRPDPTGALTSNSEIFTAIKEQLGLQLMRRTIPEKVVVIDQISRPTPN